MSTVQIVYDGTDITNSVMFKTANFESQLGAQPGQFSLSVKDPNRTLSFVTGKKIQLYIDDHLYYGGFVLQATRKFGIPVDDTTSGPTSVKTRIWELRGSDFNFLFDRRFLYNKADPRSVLTTIPGHPSDAYVLNYMCENFLDLEGIDFSTHVSAVATDAAPGSTQMPDPGYGFGSVGQSWRDAMKFLAERTGAIWYFDAAEKLWYFDRESTTPGWGFSDTPDKVTTFGFRDIEFITDASNLVNDALVWGGNPYGVSGTTKTLVFGRATDETSISNYFRSQLARARFGDTGYMNDQQAQNAANIIVYGDPGGAGGDLADTERGLQHPQRYIRLTWFGDGIPSPLIPGTVITTYLNVFGETITLPVRNIRVSFDTPTVARFQGYFGVQTDDPFSLWRYMKKIADQGGTAATLTTQPISDGSSPALVAGTEVCMIPVGYVNGTNKTFTVTDAYAPESLRVWMNGLLQRSGFEYTETNPVGKTFDFFDAPLTDDNLWVCYLTSGF